MTDESEIRNQDTIRLSEIGLKYRFSDTNPRLEILDKFMQEFISFENDFE